MHACCSSKPSKHSTTGALVLGLGLIALGLVHGLKALGYLDLEGLLFFWPTALLVLALVSFVRRGFLTFTGHLILLGAVALQLREMGHRDLLHQGWPVVLIWLGLVQVLRALFHRSRGHRIGFCEDACEDSHEA